MIFYITVLRALAAMLITNSHYVGIYPNDIIANGGLLGDVIFFAVSGFCLYNVRMKFGKWYMRRIVRVYTASVIITAAYMLIGIYQRPDGIKDVIQCFVYPTNYHFIASIIILYIPFYFVAKISGRGILDLHKVIVAVLVAYIIVYLTIYDRSYYHIDVVREPMIRFLYFEAMLIGGYFRANHEKYMNTNKVLNWVVCAGLFILYFISKTVFVKFETLSQYQIVNQIILLVLLYYIIKCFSGINGLLERLPIKMIITYLSEITLEIYVVQHAIIQRLAGVSAFPINWLIVTSAILTAASLLHCVVKIINKQTDKLFVKET